MRGVSVVKGEQPLGAMRTLTSSRRHGIIFTGMYLDDRKQRILGAVVRDYVETVRPIGSEDLAARHALGVKSATIRNELAELAELGLLRQPHTSAGRIPSDRGYRFYVDHLMEARSVPKSAARQAAALEQSLALDKLLRQTCALLTRMTSYTSMATPPRPADTQISQVFISPAGDKGLLAVVLLSTGHVETRRFAGSADFTPSDLVSVNNALNAGMAGKNIDSVIGPDAALGAPPAEFAPSVRALFESLLQVLRQMIQSAADDDQIYLEGTSEILRQPEFRDVAKIEMVLDSLQQGTMLFQTLAQTVRTSQVTVVIGRENHITAMQECSVISAPYYIGTRERGAIGVLGPTRMDYDRAIPAVNYFARALSDTLTRLETL
ncbi:heat-inducible transcription repressor HrcA [Capsulimonas corticalis]|uniref:Heat-inducible transcription repressor HrcA n=1 Tax=Capsulimonas corticalis TaxID=2219043 RepID=A0A402D3I3_9BACT|nr:heat-inducible transcriptional repressor HrcA [Capsulimonas corticalis]BDI31914.1 heat-inducible transcription repressor HrcA [Capsulimonas corticalis]